MSVPFQIAGLAIIWLLAGFLVNARRNHTADSGGLFGVGGVIGWITFVALNPSWMMGGAVALLCLFSGWAGMWGQHLLKQRLQARARNKVLKSPAHDQQADFTNSNFSGV